MKGNGGVKFMSNYDKIAQRAYQLWEKTGKPQGKETEHWLKAEAEINREQTQRGPRSMSPQAQIEDREDRRNRLVSV
jgi:hypothetical protein